MASKVAKVGVYEVEVELGVYYVSNKNGELVAQLGDAKAYFDWIGLHKEDTLHDSMMLVYEL